VIKAIGRGFNPETALKLMKNDYYLEILELREIIGKNPKVQKSKKGRVIGRDGMMRKKIEELTGCEVSVFGKTISLIGKQEDLFKAVNTIELLLKGSEHKTALKYLEEEPTEEFEI
jgi:ribosomal RNA assembly protein